MASTIFELLITAAFLVPELINLARPSDGTYTTVQIGTGLETGVLNGQDDPANIGGSCPSIRLFEENGLTFAAYDGWDKGDLKSNDLREIHVPHDDTTANKEATY